MEKQAVTFSHSEWSTIYTSLIIAAEVAEQRARRAAKFKREDIEKRCRARAAERIRLAEKIKERT